MSVRRTDPLVEMRGRTQKKTEKEKLLKTENDIGMVDKENNIKCAISGVDGLIFIIFKLNNVSACVLKNESGTESAFMRQIWIWS